MEGYYIFFAVNKKYFYYKKPKLYFYYSNSLKRVKFLTNIGIYNISTL